MNLALQVWDGLATYYELSLGVQEGNSLLYACMASWGVGVTLVGAKSLACVCVVYLYHVAYLSLSTWGLALTTLCYGLGSLLPWVLVFLM